MMFELLAILIIVVWIFAMFFSLFWWIIIPAVLVFICMKLDATANSFYNYHPNFDTNVQMVVQIVIVLMFSWWLMNKLTKNYFINRQNEIKQMSLDPTYKSHDLKNMIKIGIGAIVFDAIFIALFLGYCLWIRTSQTDNLGLYELGVTLGKMGEYMNRGIYLLMGTWLARKFYMDYKWKTEAHLPFISKYFNK